MGTSTREATQHLTTQLHELTKQFLVYDVEGRVESVYTTGYQTQPNGSCTRVEYTYVTATSSNIEKMRESNDIWLAAYDI